MINQNNIELYKDRGAMKELNDKVEEKLYRFSKDDAEDIIVLTKAIIDVASKYTEE